MADKPNEQGVCGLSFAAEIFISFVHYYETKLSCFLVDHYVSASVLCSWSWNQSSGESTVYLKMKKQC
jgi:hypothetical protein